MFQFFWFCKSTVMLLYIRLSKTSLFQLSFIANEKAYCSNSLHISSKSLQKAQSPCQPSQAPAKSSFLTLKFLSSIFQAVIDRHESALIHRLSRNLAMSLPASLLKISPDILPIHCSLGSVKDVCLQALGGIYICTDIPI